MLYTVTQPNPPAGRDFAFTVPGHYLYDVRGITATLDTALPSGTFEDVSGNGHSGSYQTFGAFGQFVPGLVAGDLAWAPNAVGPVPNYDGAIVTDGLFDWLNPFTVTWLQRFEIAEAGGGGEPFLTLGPAAGSSVHVIDNADLAGVGFPHFVVVGGAADWQTDNNAFNADGVTHYGALVWDGATLTLYQDGAVYPWTFVGAPPGAPTPADTFQMGNGAIGVGTWDEVAIFPTALAAGDIAALVTAGGLGIGSYAAVVLSLSPTAYYHLNGESGGTGRQPTLVVTDGTHELEAIPTGFGAVSTPGPYEYAWQPLLNADTQSTDGTLTTVAIPQLLLPAGYTVGVRTLDLLATDQWSNVALWWDDAYQSLTVGLPDYAYPPGAHYIYQQRGATL